MAVLLMALGAVGAVAPRPAAAQGPHWASSSAASADDAAPVDAALQPSDAVRRLIAWVNAVGDNKELPFVVVDKVAAEVFVFDAQGGFLAAAPALLGSASGDDSPPGVGDKKLADIGPEERITPAGRFMAAYGPADRGREVLWVDYDSAISLHPVVTANKKEQRVARLYSPEVDDNRITYGCINVPAAFYAKLVGPLFAGPGGVVYILPDTRALDEVFPTLQARAKPRSIDRGDGLGRALSRLAGRRFDQHRVPRP